MMRNKEIELEKEEQKKNEKLTNANRSKTNEESKKVVIVEYLQPDRPEPRPSKPIFKLFELSDQPIYANLDYFYSLKSWPEYNPLKVVWIFNPPNCNVSLSKDGKIMKIYFLTFMHKKIHHNFKKVENMESSGELNHHQKKLFSALKSVFSIRKSDITTGPHPEMNFYWLKDVFKTHDDDELSTLLI
jgi:hypothetical protein